MIPKKIHYIWIGDANLSPKMEQCLMTWEKFCPGYEIFCWNQDNYDLTSNPLILNAIDAKNWALAADVMRADVLYKYGGIYLDTDVELLRPLDELLQNKFFVGYESKRWVNNAIIGSIPYCDILKLVLEVYNFDSEIDKDSNLLAVHTYSGVLKFLYGIVPNGKSIVLDDGVALYSVDYFYPSNWLTGKLRLTENSFAIHHCANTWLNAKQQNLMKFFRVAKKLLGAKLFGFCQNIFIKKFQREVENRLISIKEQQNDRSPYAHEFE
ncbi:MAG: hypothetical protein LBU60_02320 [Clostridiales bacterium]|jgi:mannosyltransferase OCH1-like enzyme|nr:hypothetical protein [Clostridiales bacterium]